jgi:hypothetical protein
MDRLGLEAQMPNMDWDTFQDSHHRPHLVVANLASGRDPASDETTVALFERLAIALGMSGNYSITKDGAYIRAAFEIDTDAERFARVLLAKTTAGEREWASRSVSRIDGASQRKIVAALTQHRLKRPRRR